MTVENVLMGTHGKYGYTSIHTLHGAHNIHTTHNMNVKYHATRGAVVGVLVQHRRAQHNLLMCAGRGWLAGCGRQARQARTETRTAARQRAEKV